MVIGYRDTIIEAVKKLGIDSVEVMTTDTHSVNTLAGGHNPVGSKKKEEIMESIINCTKKSLDDLESVSVGCKSARIKNLNIWGPTNSTELVSTISSIVAVSRIIAPLVLLTALFFVFIWIFYGLF
jgi:putative membrane protein